MTNDANVVNGYWTKCIIDFAGKNTGLFWWDAGPDIYAYRNIRVSGDPSVDWIWSRSNPKKIFPSNIIPFGCYSLVSRG